MTAWMLIPFVAGLFLAIVAIVGRLEPIPPRCRACWYPLRDDGCDPAVVCAECGANLSLPDAIQRLGRVRSRRKLALAAVLVLVPAVPLSLGFARLSFGFDWYSHLPDRWLVDDVAKNVDNARAWAVLTDRLMRGTLPPATESVLFDLIVAELPAAGRSGRLHQPWRTALPMLLQRGNAPNLSRWTAVDNAFSAPALRVEAPAMIRQGRRASFRMRWELTHPTELRVQFRIVGVRVGGPGASIDPVWPSPTMDWPDGVYDGGVRSCPLVSHDSGSRVFMYAPLVDPGPVTLSLVVEERRGLEGPRRGFGSSAVEVGFIRPSDDHRPGPLNWSDTWLRPDEYGSRWIDDDDVQSLGAQIRTTVHEIPFTIDVEPAHEEGTVNPALVAPDNFRVLSVRACRVRSRGTERTEVELDVRGPEAVPVAYRVMLRDFDDSRWYVVGTVVIDPDAITDPTSVRTLTLTSRVYMFEPGDRVSVVVSPDWSAAQRERPEWTRIWGGSFVFDDVPFDRREE